MNYYWCVNTEDGDNKGLVWSNFQGWVTPDDPDNPPVILSEKIVQDGPVLNPIGGEWTFLYRVDNP